MGKAVILAVRFDWKDVKHMKNFGEFYEEIGLEKLVEQSIEDPDETGGEIVKANVYATSHVMAKLAAIFSKNMLNDYVKQIEEDNKDGINDKLDLQEILEYVSQREYALGFEAGMIGPEPTDLNTSTLKIIADNEDITESDPVIYIFQDGTKEHIKPHKGEAIEFLSRIEAVSGAIEKADKIVKILKKEI